MEKYVERKTVKCAIFGSVFNTALRKGNPLKNTFGAKGLCKNHIGGRPKHPISKIRLIINLSLYLRNKKLCGTTTKPNCTMPEAQ